MAAKLFYLPFPVAFTTRGVGAPSAKAYFYETGTTTPLATYTTDALTIEHPHPVVANASGRFPEIYLDNAVTARCIINDRDGAELCDIDPYVPGTAPDAGSLQPYADAAEASAVNSSASASASSTSASSASTSATNAASSASAASMSASAAAASATAADNAADAAALAVSLPSAAIPAATRTVLKSLATNAPGHLMEAGREGMFVFDSSNLSAEVTADPSEGVYVAPASDATGASGAWVRRSDGKTKIEQFGGIADSTTGADGTNNYPATLAGLQSLEWEPSSANFLFGPTLAYGIGKYRIAQTLDMKRIATIKGEGRGFDAQGAATELHFPADTAGFITNSFDTFGGVVTANTTSAYGSAFIGLKLRAATGTDLTKHGIRLRTVAEIRDVFVDNFPGDGINITAEGAGGDATRGNANGWYIERTVVKNAGHHGLRVDKSDSNAGVAIGFQCLSAAGCGIKETDTLGNVYVGPQIDGYGTNDKGRCSHGGLNYILINDTAGVGASTTPGTNDTIWYPTGAAASYTAWDSGNTYEVSCPIFAGGASNNSVYIGAYTEGGMSHIAAPAIAIGGQMGCTRTSAHIRANTTAGIVCGIGFGSYLSNSNGTLPASGHALGTEVYSTYASDLYNGELEKFSYQSNGGHVAKRLISGTANTVTYTYDGGGLGAWGYTLRNTTAKFGKSSEIVEGTFFARQIALGDQGGSLTEYRLQFYKSATAPASGEHSSGEIAYNSAIYGGNPVAAWGCIAGGTPGTWKQIAHFVIKDTTANRPTLTANDVGVQYLDTTLAAAGKPIWWTGSAWVDATGTSV